MKYNKPEITKEEIQSFIKKRIKINPTSDCWEWTKMKHKAGYGKVDFTTRPYRFYKTELIHRISFFAFKYELDSKTFVRHMCNNRICCNPNHLQPGDHQENMDDITMPIDQWSESKLLHLKEYFEFSLANIESIIRHKVEQESKIKTDKLNKIISELKRRNPGV